MGSLFEYEWIRFSVIGLIILLALTMIAFVLAAFESEHYLNSPFRGGKKITFKKALRHYLIGLYLVIGILGISYYGVTKVFDVLEFVPKILISIGGPLLALVAAYINSKNEKYLFLKIKEFIEGFLTIATVLVFILGCIGYYITFFN